MDLCCTKQHDPEWGVRSAAQRYYDFFPELYLKRIERDGALGFVGATYLAPHLEDFAASFAGVGNVTLTPEQAEAFKKNGLQAFKHREPWAWWHRVQFADNKNVRTPSRLGGPGDPKQPSHEEELAIIEKKKHEPPEVRDGNDQIPGPVREVAAAAQRCFVYDENNQPRRCSCGTAAISVLLPLSSISPPVCRVQVASHNRLSAISHLDVLHHHRLPPAGAQFL